ncbi:MAG: DedA family protein [Bacteroidales bacterium]|nr:DedA family protein [Bacteroidales bacterium]
MEFIQNSGYFGIFIISFLSATIIPFSSDVVVAAMSVANFNPFLLLIIATSGNTLGGMTNYCLGYLGKLEWAKKHFKISENKIQKANNFVKKYSKISALFTWLPFIGDIIALVLGLFRINFIVVLTFMFIGKGLRYFTIIFVIENIKRFF